MKKFCKLAFSFLAMMVLSVPVVKASQSIEIANAVKEGAYQTVDEIATLPSTQSDITSSVNQLSGIDQDAMRQIVLNYKQQNQDFDITDFIYGAKPQSKVPGVQKAAGDGFGIYGMVLSSKVEGRGVGLYRFNDKDEFTLYSGNITSSVYSGTLHADKYYAYVHTTILGIAIDNFYIYDWPSVEKVKSSAIVASKLAWAIASDDAYVYGCFGYSAPYIFGRLDPDTYEIIPIAQLSARWNAMACDNTGQIYAIDTKGVLYKVNKTSGAMTTIGSTGVTPKYVTSATIDRKTNRMYWTYCDGTVSALYEVNLETAKATLVTYFAGGEEVTGLFIPFEADATAPAAAELVANFPEGTLKGSIDFTVPANLAGGAAGTGTVQYNVYVDGFEAAKGTAAYGSKVSIPKEFVAEGNHTFTVTLRNAAGISPVARVYQYIGFDTPVTPVVTSTYDKNSSTFSVKWNAITNTVFNGYMVPSEVRYDVTRIPDNVKVASDIAETSITDVVPEPESSTTYTYSVVAKYHGKSSLPGESNGIRLGSNVPPYLEMFDTQSDFNSFTVIDGYNDGKTWEWNSAAQAARCHYSTSNAKDEWLISPPFKFEAGKIYKLAFKSKAYYASSTGREYGSDLTVAVGKAENAASMTIPVMPKTTVTGDTWVDLDGAIQVSETGTYYIGFHATSDKTKFYIFVDSISVAAGSSTKAPAVCENVKVTPGLNGALNAEVTLKTPEKDIEGNALSSLTSVTIKRDGNVVKTFSAPALGADLSYTDNVAKSGDYTYVVYATNADGDGYDTTVKVHIGGGIPSNPANVTLSEPVEYGKVLLSWDPVTTNVYGAPIDPSTVTYEVCEANETYTVIATLPGTTTEYEFTAVEPGSAPKFVTRCVRAIDSNGNSDYVFSNTLAAGKPYELPYKESFAGAKVETTIGVVSIDGTTKWSLYKDGGAGYYNSADLDGGFIGHKGTTSGNSARFFTAKINLKDVKYPRLSFKAFKLGTDTTTANGNLINVLVKDDMTSDKWTSVKSGAIKDICTGRYGEWSTIDFPITQYAGKDIQIAFESTIKTYTLNFVDAIEVYDCELIDLAATAITCSSTEVKPNERTTIYVTVMNMGSDSIKEYTASLYRVGEKEPLYTNTTAYKSHPLAPGESYKVPCYVTFRPADEQIQRLYGTCDTEFDMDFNNETGVLELKLIKSTIPAPTNLQIEANDEGKPKLTWTAPVIPSEMSKVGVEDFDSFTSWSLEGKNGWTFVDKDQKPIGTPEKTISKFTPGTTTAGFFTFYYTSTWGSSYKPHSGSKCLATLYANDNTQIDDYLISPELSGAKQTVKFWAKIAKSLRYEYYRVLYSTGSKNLEDFVELVAPTKLIYSTWHEYSFTLPAGAKYFAINSCGGSDGKSLMLLIDDITFEPANTDLYGVKVKEYNIYRGSSLLGTSSKLEYVDKTAVEGESYDYYVTATLSTSEETSNSNIVSFNTPSGVIEVVDDVTVYSENGKIHVDGAAGKNVVISSVNGLVYQVGVANSDLVVSVAPGIYIVKIDAKATKILVK